MPRRSTPFVLLLLIAAPGLVVAQSPSREEATLLVWLRDAGIGEESRLALDRGTRGATSTEIVDRVKADVVARHRGRMLIGVTAPFVAAARAAGFDAPFVGELAPLVALRGDETRLIVWLRSRREALAWEVDVAGGFAELEYAVPSVRGDWVRTHPTTPLTGAGVAVGVLDTGKVETSNPYLPAGVIVNGSPSVQAHSTGVAGIVASSHPVQTGMAPGVCLLSTAGGSTTSALVLNGQWAYSNGADLVTCSLVYGSTSTNTLSLADRGFDYLTRSLGKTFVKSCGNQGNSGNVTTPGRGWNSIAVGAFDESSNARWSDDSMASFSSGGDPSTGAPKPEVAAPGVSVTSLTTSAPWIGGIGDGTSFAAPHVAGLVALLMEQTPALKTRPEAVKALVMVSAWHNVEGASDLSNLDGVGAIDAAAAFNTNAAGRVLDGIWTPSSFAATGSVDLLVPLKAGNRTRAVLSWSANAGGAATSYSPDGRDAIFDLAVFAPGAPTPLALSTANGGSWRIVSFMAPTSGTYVFRATAAQFLGATEPYGLAVSQRFDGDVNRIVGLAPLALGATRMPTLSDPYHPGASWILGIGVSGGSYDLGVPLTERVVPLIPDAVTTLAFTPGNGVVTATSGVLNSVGQATTTIVVPNLPWLVGYTASFVLVTLDPAFVDGVAGVSPRYSAPVVP